MGKQLLNTRVHEQCMPIQNRTGTGVAVLRNGEPFSIRREGQSAVRVLHLQVINMKSRFLLALHDMHTSTVEIPAVEENKHKHSLELQYTGPPLRSPLLGPMYGV